MCDSVWESFHFVSKLNVIFNWKIICSCEDEFLRIIFIHILRDDRRPNGQKCSSPKRILTLIK